MEQMWCSASKSARGDGKFAANAATPLQHASAGDSPPTTLLYFSLLDYGAENYTTTTALPATYSYSYGYTVYALRNSCKELLYFSY